MKRTELPFTGKYWNCKEDDDVYRCVVCSNELFDSETKFDPAGRVSGRLLGCRI
jgi:peptide methionine sulfoxide reductase MsrB